MSADRFLELLADYEVVTWVSSEDGPLNEDLFEDVDLLIWDSGNYQNTAGFLDEDINVIFSYLDDGGPALLTGSMPSVFGDIGELAPLVDLEIVGDDDTLLEGLEAGDVITLDDTYEVMLADTLPDEADPGSVAFFVRGPESDTAGDIVGIAAVDQFSDQRSILLILPFVVLPEEIQETLLPNMLNWLALPVEEE